MIDLRSDTVTRPTEAMRACMSQAPVGDDVFGEDPSVNELEAKVADLFAKEAALFCSSGTMANQLAIKAHTRPGDQVICSWAAHVYNYEGGGMAMNSGVTAKLLEGNRGMFTAVDVESAISPDDPHFPISKLVCIEDTVNKGGGAIWKCDDLRAIKTLCENKGLKTHLDGARVFNRLVASNDDSKQYGTNFDSISICLTKGLGAPVGSVLTGDKDFINLARRYRKALGGGMRQAGVLASAGIFALDNHVERLSQDQLRAKGVAEALKTNPDVVKILPVESNIVIFELAEPTLTQQVLDYLKKEGVLAFATSSTTIRFVFHLDVSEAQAKQVASLCSSFTR